VIAAFLFPPLGRDVSWAWREDKDRRQSRAGRRPVVRPFLINAVFVDGGFVSRLKVAFVLPDEREFTPKADKRDMERWRGAPLKKRGKALKGVQAGRPLLQLAFVQLDGILVAEIEGVADQGVADGDLVEMGDMPGEILEVVEVEVMAGVEAETQFVGAERGFMIGGDGERGVGEVLMGVGFGIEFDAIGARFGGAIHHGDHGVDEE
jgi:hypothetical protein